jgi:hypothetical protein
MVCLRPDFKVKSPEGAFTLKEGRLQGKFANLRINLEEWPHQQYLPNLAAT